MFSFEDLIRQYGFKKEDLKEITSLQKYFNLEFAETVGEEVVDFILEYLPESKEIIPQDEIKKFSEIIKNSFLSLFDPDKLIFVASKIVNAHIKAEILLDEFLEAYAQFYKLIANRLLQLVSEKERKKAYKLLFLLNLLPVFYTKFHLWENISKIQKSCPLDSITGLPLRAALRKNWKFLKQKVEEKLSYVLLDLKDFSVVNGAYGYQIGDAYIAYIAGVLRRHFKEKGFKSLPNVYRLASDEFIILLNASAKEAVERLKELQRYFEITPFLMPDKAIPVSFAAAVMEVEDVNIDACDILWIVERGLKEFLQIAKEGITVIDKDWVNRLKKRRENLAIVREALNEERVTFALQKIIDIETGDIFAYEVLARIIDKNGKILPAGIFIEDITLVGFTMEMDKIVIDKALRYKKEKGIKKYFSLNLSNKLLENEIDYFIDLVYHYQIDPGEIIVELTERESFAAVKDIIERVNRLKEKGFKIFIDDFGVEYSNFNLIESYPIDGIKIDGSYIKKMKESWLDQKFVKFILDVASELSLKVVAEYVEFEETIDLLRALCEEDKNKCILAQGYLFGKPEVIR